MSKDLLRKATVSPEDIVEAIEFSEIAQSDMLDKIRKQHYRTIEKVYEILGDASKLAKRVYNPDAFRDDIILSNDVRVTVHTRKESYLDKARFVTSATLLIDGSRQDLICSAINVKAG